MPPRRAQSVGDGLPEYARFYRRTIGLQRKAKQPGIGAVTLAEGNDTPERPPPCAAAASRSYCAVVAIKNGGTA